MAKSSCFPLCTLVLILLLDAALSTTSENGCPDRSSRWVDLGGDFCYIIELNHTLTWIDAVYHCFNEGGSLASFHSFTEIERVVRYGNKESVGLYIGLWKHNDGNLEWVDKSALNYRNWDSGEPNLDYEKCVQFYVDSGKWNDIDCNRALGYICSSPKRQLPPGPRKVCPYSSSKWKDFNGEVCYILERENKATWYDALRRCSEEGSSLASFHSIEEISAVLQRIKHYNEGYHIGLKQDNHGKYQWTDGSTADLEYWKFGEPNDSQRRCGEISSESGQWNDVSCETPSGYICSSPKDVCGGDIHLDSGYIHSPNYPGYYEPLEDCIWSITVPEDHQVVLQFESFHLEKSVGCLNDFVKILDGDEPGSKILAKICGRHVPAVIRSSKNKMAIKLVTDYSGQMSGFSAKFTKARICADDIVAEKGVILSPNYPHNYAPGENCVWRITVPENYKVSLKFLTFKVSAIRTRHICNDFVQIRDGHEATSPVLARFCGFEMPDGIVSSGNKMTVLFSSDLFTEDTGFSAEFEQDFCGGNIISESGNFSSPNYPMHYRRNEECTWKIRVPESYQVALQFQQFYMETGDNCIYDFVEIRDGHESDSSLLAKFCGSNLPVVIRSTTNKMTVKFVSDNSHQARGFFATFMQAKFHAEDIVAEQGILQSPNYPNSYGPAEKSMWKITVPGENRILMKFLAFRVDGSDDCQDDFVQIRDGHGPESPILGNFCGHNVPDALRTSGNKMTVVFESDLSKEDTGFSATFQKYLCAEDIYSESGSISSPNYPGNYGKVEACTWNIAVPEGYQVSLQFKSFDLEDGLCDKDFVEVRDGHESDSTLLGKFCGGDIPEVIRSSKNKLSITFMTDISDERQGFSATFTKDVSPSERPDSELLQFPILALRKKVRDVMNKTLDKRKQLLKPFLQLR